MLDFILAGIIYLLVVFVVLFCFSFVTIGITYAVTRIVRRCLGWRQQPELAVK